MTMSDTENNPQNTPLQASPKEEDMDATEPKADASCARDESKDIKPNDKIGTVEDPIMEDEASDDSGAENEDTNDKESKEGSIKLETHAKSKDESEAEESDESEEEELKLGLLEQPVIILCGKREKRKVERLEIAVSTPKETEYKEGSGTKLGEIPAIEHHITKSLAEELKPLHRVLFGKVGTISMVKKNIRKFNGFPFDANSREYKKKEQILNKLTTSILKPICETLMLERSGNKEVLVNRVLEFLINPQDSGKGVPIKRKRSSKGTSKSKKAAKGDKEKKVKKAAKKKENKSENASQSEDGAGDSDDSEKESEKSEEEEQPKTKKAKIETKKVMKTPKRKKEESESEKEDDALSDSECEEKPKENVKKAVKKKKSPTEDEINETVKKILEGANLEEVTMKTVCKQVYAKFPDFDITGKKDFIKASVKQLIK